jgi:hypothetical protein
MEMRSSGTRRVSKRAPESSFICGACGLVQGPDACLCVSCRRLIFDEVKHCVFDQVEGSFVLCDSCYLRDERRNSWEHRGDPLPRRWGRVVGG